MDQGHDADAADRLANAARMYRAAQYRMGEALTTSGRARLELRAGRIDEAIALLDDARTRFTALGATNFVLDTDVRLVEALVFAVRSEEALRLADATRSALDRFADLAVVPVTLDRLAAAALAQLGRKGEARELLAHALQQARSSGVLFEVLSVLALQQRLEGARCTPCAAGTTEMDALQQKLGVVRVFGPPLAGLVPDPSTSAPTPAVELTTGG